MPLINLRDLVAYPDNGLNTSDTVINGVHLNKTALEYWNYTLYSNNTLSNDSNCYVIFDNFKPSILSNGTFINATSCYMPYYGIGTRGKLGIAFASFFAASIMFTLVNLRKHGTKYLREDKRFRIVGRRWQWYWMLFVAACGIISGISAVDVDRNYLVELAILLQPFFFYLLTPGIIACVWEATRHWGSWQERQICDEDPNAYRHDDRRAKAEFYLPLIFYLFDFLDFFMTVPRPWSDVERQRDPWQISTLARPNATDGRFKAGGIMAFFAFCVIVYDLNHNLHYYKPRSTGVFGKLDKFARECPTRLFLALICLIVLILYQVLSAWIWDISLMRYGVDNVWPYACGYTPVALIIVIFNVYGVVDENEDKQLMAQRIARGRSADAELGLVKKPHWWSRVNNNLHNVNAEQKLLTEVGGGKPTTRNLGRDLELRDLSASQQRASYLQAETTHYSDHPDIEGPPPRTMSVSTANTANANSNNGELRDRSRSRPGAGGVPYRNSSLLDPFADPPRREVSPSAASDDSRGRGLLQVSRPTDGLRRDESAISQVSSQGSEVSAMTGTTLNTAQPQKIRSMLDI